MKNLFVLILFAAVLGMACERVAPNYAGVLMENYGKNGKEDYSLQKRKSQYNVSRNRIIPGPVMGTTI